jgi:hypothetical protein
MVGSTIGFDTSGLKIRQSSKQEFFAHRAGMGRGIRMSLHHHTKFIKDEKPPKKKSK